MTDEQKKFVTDLVSESMSHEQWVAIMRFGMVTLLQDQPFLIYLIANRAEHELEAGLGPDYWTVADYARDLFSDLGIRFVPADEGVITR